MATATDIDRVRVVVLGDSGVGKSSLVYLMCQEQPIVNSYWTIGASVDVKLHDYREGTPQKKTYFVEFVDVGGSASHENSRYVFYHTVHGIILVHDLINRKSHTNLRKWLWEVLNKESPSNNGNGTRWLDFDVERFAGNQIPILLIGTKLDLLLAEKGDMASMSLNSEVAEECGAAEMNIDCTNSKHLAPGTTNAVKLSRFFDKVVAYSNLNRHSGKVIDKRMASNNINQQVVTGQERRRPLTPQNRRSWYTEPS